VVNFLESTADQGDHFEIYILGACDTLKPGFQVSTDVNIFSFDTFGYQRLMNAYGRYLTTRLHHDYLPAFKFHPKANCTAEERNGAQNFHKMDGLERSTSFLSICVQNAELFPVHHPYLFILSC
jgi:hypothetical protein